MTDGICSGRFDVYGTLNLFINEGVFNKLKHFCISLRLPYLGVVCMLCAHLYALPRDGLAWEYVRISLKSRETCSKDQNNIENRATERHILILRAHFAKNAIVFVPSTVRGEALQTTIYNTPIIKTIFKYISILGLKIAGWRLDGTLPQEKKYVLAAYPHVSNWDFPLTLAMGFVFGFKVYWMGKDSLFVGPLGPIMRWLGGIPVYRDRSTNLVQQTIEAYNNAEELVVTIALEGTRSKVKEWKLGFYHIASGAEVPIALGFLDYDKKVGGFGPTFYPSGDVDGDVAEIKSIYRKMLNRKEPI